MRRSLLVRPSAPIFGIGLNKTGTRSVAQATRLLGLRTLHNGDPELSRRVDESMDRGSSPFDVVDRSFEAIFDVEAVVRRFAQLDERHPGARFILTTRSMEDWIESRRRHVEANRRRHEVGEYDGGFLVVDVPRWEEEWIEHHRAVRSHFDGRADLLELDVTDSPGWEPLASFLGERAPRAAFPWQNRAGRGTYAPEGRLEPLGRRVAYARARASRVLRTAGGRMTGR